MHHLAAYTASFTSTAETDLAALTDTSLTISNGHFLPQRPAQLAFWGAAGATLSKVRMSTPKLAVITTPFLRDLNVAANMGVPMRFDDLHDMPLNLAQLEEIQMLVTHTAAGAEQDYAFIGLQIQNVPRPAGDMYCIRGTSAATLTANAWTNLSPITWQNALPTGLYACIGASFFSAGALAGRLIFENWPWRPGGFGIQALGNLTDRIFRHGNLGVWGQFHNYVMPQVEMLSVSADTSEEVTMDLIKIG